ncbi:MAG TPA: YbbC/YhhH family protein [Pyrinomonadaceae bacterium]|nr:YbbC/YhhH family protein [Pyrinomonadaceae bacterium]
MNQPTPAKSPARRAGTFMPPKGFVPDEQTAISIAVAVWSPIYGREQIESEKPFKASLKDGVWTVTGTLPEGYNGGTAIADISQETGCILRVIHEQ